MKDLVNRQKTGRGHAFERPGSSHKPTTTNPLGPEHGSVKDEENTLEHMSSVTPGR